MYACKPCFVKLEKGCKMIHGIQHGCKRLLSLLHVPVMVTTAFPDVEKPSQVAQSKQGLKLWASGV